MSITVPFVSSCAWAAALWMLSMPVAQAEPVRLADAGNGARVPLQAAQRSGWTPVGPARLDQARGGFSTGSGLELSLGIERTVSINGELISRSTLQVADLRAMSSEQAQALKQAFSSVSLVQNGARSTLANGSLAPGTFVQNTLNDQMIGTSTVISTTVNSASLMKELNFMSSVRDASLNALGGR